MNRYRRVSALILIFSLLCALRLPVRAQSGGAVPAEPRTGAEASKYYAYSEEHAEIPSAGITLEVPLDTLQLKSGKAYLQEGFEGSGAAVLVTEEESDIQLSVEVGEAALYGIHVEYYTQAGKGSAIERSLYIDGALPFSEAESLVLSRVYKDKTPIKNDEQGDDLRPEYEEIPGWYGAFLKDASGLYNQPFQFYFSKGTHTIRLESVKEPCVFRKITLCPLKQAISYSGYKAQHSSRPKAGEASEAVQAEDVLLKSDYSIYAGVDRSSALTQPVSDYQIKYNCIPSDKFKAPGQWITWELTASESGMYKIAARFKQDSIQGGFVSRRLLINDEVPFSEAEAIRFYYDSRWQTEFFGNDDGAFEFYLAKGKNKITLEVVLGDVAQTVSRVEDCVNELNACYWDIVMVTGTTPDLFRDYYFETIIPDTLAEMKKLQGELNLLSEGIKAEMREKTSSYTTAFEKLIFDLEGMTERPKTIAAKLEGFKVNIGSLASWVLEAGKQPMALDYLMAMPPDAAKPKANAGFWTAFVYQLKLYAASYMFDYSSVNTGGGRTPVTVWISSGRDQALLLKDLIDTGFSAKSNVGVNLQLVDASTLLRSIVAGTSPDVALSQVQTTPLNYAIRGAVLDLSGFKEFDAVAKRFGEAAMTPFLYNGACYALPETLSFPMMFYRKDILDRLGVSPPETWDDVSALMLLLSTNDLEFGLPANLDSFLMMLFQSGIQLYNDDFTAVNLETVKAYEIFNRWCGYYLTYGLDVAYDFSNRFRTGEMPVGIADFIGTYNQLSVFAPEIRGKWSFTLVPGTRQADGGISHAVSPGVTCAMALYNTKYPEVCWEFLKWWTGTETQLEYGRELESIVGIGSRYASANEQAMAQSAWPVRDYRSIKAQRDQITGLPECPGSYMTSRYIDFAFKSVINDNQDSTTELIRYTEMINKELVRKQEEFALN